MKLRLILPLLWVACSLVATEPTNLIEILRDFQRGLDESAQAAPPPAKERKPPPVTAPARPEAEPPPASQALDPARLNAGDVLEILVADEPELSLPRTTVSRDGTIQYPMLGALNVAGNTVAEAEILVRDRLAKDYLVDPRVTVRVLEPARCTFTIRQHVTKPGVYTWLGNENMTVLRAIGMAGGTTRSASLARITVRRINNGKPEIMRLDLDADRRNQTANPFLLKDGDVVEVGGR